MRYKRLKSDSIFDIAKGFQNDSKTMKETYAQRHKRERLVKKAWIKVKTTKKQSLLYGDIYDIIYYAYDRGDFYADGFEIIEEASKAYQIKDIYRLEQLLEMIKLPQEIRRVPFLIDKIIREISLSESEELKVYDTLSLLKNNQEALIVYKIVKRNICNLPYRTRGYQVARKLKTRQRKMVNTYEHQLRFERHFLERLLQKIGVGINRSKKISQALSLIK